MCRIGRCSFLSWFDEVDVIRSTFNGDMREKNDIYVFVHSDLDHHHGCHGVPRCMHGQAPRYLAYHFTTSSDVASRLRLRETFFVFLVTRVQRYVSTKLDVSTAFQF